jgi:hypothetical protein
MIQPFTLYLVAALIGAFAVAMLALAALLPQAAAGRLRSESKTESELKLSSLAARVPISEIRDGSALALLLSLPMLSVWKQ